MAGMSDLPFRTIAYALGATYGVGEMTSAKPELRGSKKSAGRWASALESGLRVVQLVGADPAQMASAARFAVETGAQVVDINMGCPAKKVLQAACGSALLKDEAAVERILKAVVAAVDVPVTLKIRTGWSAERRNAVAVARLAEDVGIRMLTVHGRTGEQAFRGEAEYDTIAEVVSAVQIPVLANGDIDSGDKALSVLAKTGAAGVMIGRASYGNPWIFSEVRAALAGDVKPARPTVDERRAVIARHRALHFEAYEETQAVRSFRKHLRHYLKGADASVVDDLMLAGDAARQAELIEAALLTMEGA